MVDEGTLGVHQVEFVVDTGEDFGDSGAVRDPNSAWTVSLRYWL